MKKDKTFAKVEDFKKKTQINDKLGLDERDNIIMSLVQKNPNISQDEISKKIKLSQPSVGARLKRLQDKGILQSAHGVNFKTVDLNLAKVEVNATDTKAIIDEFIDCPFFVNAFVTSGKFNLSIMFVATDLKRLEGIVNHHLRGNEKVKEIRMDIIISTAKNLIMPLNIDYENNKQLGCPQHCKDCLE